MSTMHLYRIMISLIVFYGGISTATASTIETKDIRIVGSSTVAPFVTKVVRLLEKEGLIKSPDIQITGTGVGFEKFCASNGEESPDITGASRRIKVDELRDCDAHDIDVYELIFGFDGVVVADHAGSNLSLSRKQLFLALAAEVPDSSGHRLIKNPYHFWDEIDVTLPHRRIKILGGPRSSGTFDTIKHKVMLAVSKDLPAYKGLSYGGVRDDGVYVNDHEDHNYAVEALGKNQDVLAIFGYSYYINNSGKITAIPIDGYRPIDANIITMKYSLARPLYIYVKEFHLKTDQNVELFINRFLSDKIIASGGLLEMVGLISLPQSMVSAARLSLQYSRALSVSELGR